MKKLSRLKTSLLSLPFILAVILVFISSDSDKDMVKGVFTDMTQIAHADVAGVDCSVDCGPDGSSDPAPAPDPGTGSGCPNGLGDEFGDPLDFS